MRTDGLRASGVREVRVLSESKFVQMVERIVRQRMDEYLQQEGDAPAATAAANDAENRRHQDSWEHLRRTQRDALSKVEERMERLASIFQKLQTSVAAVEAGRSDQAGPVPEATHVVGMEAAPPTAEAGAQRVQLIRDMFEKPGRTGDHSSHSTRD